MYSTIYKFLERMAYLSIQRLRVTANKENFISLSIPQCRLAHLVYTTLVLFIYLFSKFLI